MSTTVVGRVSNAREAESVVQDLVSTCSCKRADISLLDQGSPRAAESGRAEFGTLLMGIVGGAVVGGIAGYVVAAASVPVPAVFATVIAAGPIHSAILGGFIGSVAFGVAGALIGAATRGADTYDFPGARHPGALIMVHARNDQETDCVVNVMRQHGVAEISKRSSNGGKPNQPIRSVVGDPLMDPPLRTDPKLSAGNSPVTGSPGLRSNRLPEAAATDIAREAATKVNSRAGWITRKYTATYYGPERRTAANQSPYQGAERRQSA
jgi:hypothetical protein